LSAAEESGHLELVDLLFEASKIDALSSTTSDDVSTQKSSDHLRAGGDEAGGHTPEFDDSSPMFSALRNE